MSVFLYAHIYAEHTYIMYKVTIKYRYNLVLHFTEESYLKHKLVLIRKHWSLFIVKYLGLIWKKKQLNKISITGRISHYSGHRKQPCWGLFVCLFCLLP